MIALLAACVAGPGEGELVPVDTGAFFAEVEPVLGERCANPACHGSADRPLEVYAEHRHRLDTGDAWRDLPLTPDEHAANLLRARGFAGPPYAIARKGLAPEAGGMGHGGGAIWLSADEPEYAAILAWAEGR
ncbi:MAG: hypothetical protein ACOZNI_29515 [Myxococcota bacterium]